MVSHDLLKFATLLTGRNGYVLEQLLSPLVVVTATVHAELKALAAGWSPATMHITTSASPPARRSCTAPAGSSNPPCTPCESC